MEIHCLIDSIAVTNTLSLGLLGIGTERQVIRDSYRNLRALVCPQSCGEDKLNVRVNLADSERGQDLGAICKGQHNNGA